MDDPYLRFLGKRVRIILQRKRDYPFIPDIKDVPGSGPESDVDVITTGVLLGFSQGGEFEILEDDGFVHYCWPLLDIEEAVNE